MLWNALLLAMREIRRNVMRSFLTILGIVIGVAAVIIMVTLGGGATVQVTQQIENMGSNLLHVRPGQRGRGPGGTRSIADMLELADAEAIAREISGLAAVAPNASQATQAHLSATRTGPPRSPAAPMTTCRCGTGPLKNGRQFTAGELHAGKAVCILGSSVRDQLFGAQEPLGATIRLEKLSCQVVGVLEPKGSPASARIRTILCCFRFAPCNGASQGTRTSTPSTSRLRMVFLLKKSSVISSG